ncbi:hypothetical protein B9J09_02485 [Xylella fastidiosa subsp. pauca]|nr:hypothetical protein B9J09_02485 [Xylella fastidiosa subsp. pauca]AVI20248.1 hypothetical protein BCV75_02330 [Xylella fastidiosa]KIA59251.1 hypothetical protein RA12_02355 [Xylella fastidiosa]KXB18504.1 hypothetical protein ADT31_01980 [Xylella fastidiosa]
MCSSSDLVISRGAARRGDGNTVTQSVAARLLAGGKVKPGNEEALLLSNRLFFLVVRLVELAAF